MVSRYDLQVFAQASGTSIATVSLGKPAPEQDGRIRVDFSVLLPTWPLPAGSYSARVTAIGPAGSGTSEPSNVFEFQSASPPVSCSQTVSPSIQTVTASGGATAATVASSASSCSWTAASNAAWLTVSPASGMGSGTVTVTAQANSGAARSGTATIGGQTYTVNQSAAPVCSFTVGAVTASAASTGTTGAVTLTASAPTCAWTATASVSWITLPATSGTGSASVAYTVAKSSVLAERSGTITVGGRVVTITQAAAARPNAPKGLKIK